MAERLDFDIVARSNPLAAELKRSQEGAARLKDMLGSIAKPKSGSAANFGMSDFNRSLTTAQKGAGALVSVLGVGMVGAIGAATAGMVAFVGQLKGAIDRQKELITLTTQVANVTGLSRTDSRAAAIDLRKALSAQSGGLVDTAISGKIANNIFDDIVKANKGDIGQSIKQSANISNRLGFLSSSGGVDQGQLSNVLTDYFSGSLSTAGLKGRDAFIDTGINKVLIPLIERSGKDLKDLTNQQRKDLFEQAANLAAPDEAILESAKNISGLFQVQMFKLFDPSEGLFSIERELRPIAGYGSTVLDEFTSTITLLIGKDGVLNSIGSVLKKTGIDLGDPMENFREGLHRFNNSLDSIANAIDGFSLPNFTGGFSIKGLGSSLAGFFNQGVAGINQWFGSFSPEFASDVGGAIGTFVGQLLGETNSFLMNLDYSQILMAIGNGSIAILQGVAGFFGGLYSTLGAYQAQAFDDLRQAALDGFNTLWQVVKQTIADGFNYARDALYRAGQKALQRLPFIGEATEQVNPQQINATPRFLGSPDFMAQMGISSRNMPLGSAIATELANKPPGSQLVIANSSELILSQRQQSSLASALGGGINATFNITQQPGESTEALTDRIMERMSRLLDHRMRLQFS